MLKTKQNWFENKCKVKLSLADWKKLIAFISEAKLHLLLRIINLKLQIVIRGSEKDTQEAQDDLEKLLLKNNDCGSDTSKKVI